MFKYGCCFIVLCCKVEQKQPKKHIKNARYRKFLDEGIIKTLKEEDIILVCQNIKHKYPAEARNLIITLYLTGARPNEALKLKGKDFKDEGKNITISLQPSKKGLPRTIYLQRKNKLVDYLAKYGLRCYDEAYIFPHFRGGYNRKRVTKRGIIERIEYADKLRYWVKKWFSVLPDGTITTYFLRHNRFSRLAEAGATMEQIRLLKGARTFDSVTPYLHMSTETAKKMSKKIN
ncbi:MAG: site specific recombinase [Siphoviridae sp. ctjeG17]|jgi:integrase|nr:MAG: site specific recombinase [Siphoviridae sp. ctjeG17]